MKEIVGKTKAKKDIFPKFRLGDENKTKDKRTIARALNEYCVNIGLKLASVIPETNISFKTYLTKPEACLNENLLNKDEFQKAQDSLKSHKTNEFDEMHVNVIKLVYDQIKALVLHVFDNSSQFGIFPEKMKLAKVTPIFKSGKEELLTNYSSISVLLRFSKILERIMYNRLYAHLSEHNLLLGRHIGFRAGYSTEHDMPNLLIDY